MRLDKDKIKESLSESEIELILRDLGSATPKQDTQGNLLFSTVCHKGSKHKLYYYPKTQTFRCFTDCSESYDVYSLVEKVKKVSFYESVRYVANLTGKYYTSTSQQKQSHIISDWDFIERYQKKEKINTHLPSYNENVLDVFLPYGHEEWESEGISLEIQRKFGISYYVKHDQIIIPCRDIDNRLIGIRARNLREEEILAGKKYIPAIIEGKMYNFPTLMSLYGLNITKNRVRELKKVAIFESEKSCMLCEEYYQEDNFSCATGGSAFGTFHRDILLSLNVDEIIYCPDKEFEDPTSEEAYRYAEKIKKIAKKFTPYFKFFVVWDNCGLLSLKQSPCDKGKEVLEELMKRKIEITTEGG